MPASASVRSCGHRSATGAPAPSRRPAEGPVRRLLTAVAVALVTEFVATPSTAPPAGAGGSLPGVPEIHVRGDQLVDGDGDAVRLIGVNRSGSEYACVVGGGGNAGIFGGPSGARSIQAMKDWHANSVRV